MWESAIVVCCGRVLTDGHGLQEGQQWRMHACSPHRLYLPGTMPWCWLLCRHQPLLRWGWRRWRVRDVPVCVFHHLGGRVRGGALAVARDRKETEAQVHALLLAALGRVCLTADARELLDTSSLQPVEPLLHVVHRLCMIRLMTLPAVKVRVRHFTSGAKHAYGRARGVTIRLFPRHVDVYSMACWHAMLFGTNRWWTNLNNPAGLTISCKASPRQALFHLYALQTRS